jgi:hypothetical protein
MDTDLRATVQEGARLLTALIFAEKCFPLGLRIAQFAAMALILYGAFVIVVPAALPLSGAGM